MLKFYDKQSGKEIDSVRFGIVRVGESKIVDLTVENTGNSTLLDMKFLFDNPEVEVVKAPVRLNKKESGLLSVKWLPRLKPDRGLQCSLKFTADELFGEDI